MMEKTDNKKISPEREWPTKSYINFHERHNLPPYFYLLLNNEDSAQSLAKMEEIGLKLGREVKDLLEKEENFNKQVRLFIHDETVRKDNVYEKLVFNKDELPNPLNIKRFPLDGLYRELKENEKIDQDKIAVEPFNTYLLHCVSPEKLTEHICYDAVLTDVSYIKRLPPELMSDRIIRTVLHVDGMYIQEIPNEKLKDYHYLMAINTSPEAIRFCPQKLIDTEVCLNAVKKSAHALTYIPDSLKTKEMCRIGLSQFHSQINLLQAARMLSKVPFPDVVSEEIKKIMELRGPVSTALQSIKENVIDAQLAEDIVTHDGKLFNYLPSEFQTYNNALIAVSVSGIENVDMKFWNEETINTHIINGHDLYSLRFVNEFTPLTPENYLLIYKCVPEFLKMPEGFAEKKVDFFNDYNSDLTIPESIIKEPNVFSLTIKVEKQTGNKLSISDAYKLINGESVPFTRPLQETKYPQKGTIEFDKDKGVLRIKEPEKKIDNALSKQHEQIAKKKTTRRL